MGRESPDVRFWRKVEKTDTCWLWRGALSPAGYGIFAWNRTKLLGAHRVAFLLARGEIASGLIVRHSCERRDCVNPKHLTLGTRKNGLLDAMKKRRTCCGETRSNAKLHEASVREIRRAVQNGMPVAELAKKFGVSKSVVSGVANRKNWRHVL